MLKLALIVPLFFSDSVNVWSIGIFVVGAYNY